MRIMYVHARSLTTGCLHFCLLWVIPSQCEGCGMNFLMQNRPTLLPLILLSSHPSPNNRCNLDRVCSVIGKNLIHQTSSEKSRVSLTSRGMMEPQHRSWVAITLCDFTRWRAASASAALTASDWLNTPVGSKMKCSRRLEHRLHGDLCLNPLHSEVWGNTLSSCVRDYTLQDFPNNKTPKTLASTFVKADLADPSSLHRHFCSCNNFISLIHLCHTGLLC